MTLGVLNSLMDAVNDLKPLRELSLVVNSLQSGIDEQLVPIELRMSQLHLLELAWTLELTTTVEVGGFLAGFLPSMVILDWEDIKSVGLPHLEELNLDLKNIDVTCPGQQDIYEFPSILYEAVLHPERTPVLAYAKVDVFGNIVKYEFDLNGGRNNFSAEILGEMKDDLDIWRDVSDNSSM
ncbi:hypothetical protein HK101_007091 [Irineochytrium annulatum]|nr:hypothetical protein HK101_007091 [Irineochytrium annulatum]